MKKQNIFEMSKRDFQRVCARDYWNEETEGTSFVVVPAETDWVGLIKFNVLTFVAKLFKFEVPEPVGVRHLHDSGFRCLDVVVVQNNEPVCRVAGCSDAIHLDGIGGWGEEGAAVLLKGGLVKLSGWTVDCLPKSGLLHFFPSPARVKVGAALSSLEVYALENEDDA